MSSKIGEAAAVMGDLTLEQDSTVSEQVSKELRCKTMSDQENVSHKQSIEEDLELRQLEEELKSLKEALRMVEDTKHPASFYIEQLKEQIDARRHNLHKLECERDASIKALEEKRWSLLKSLCEEKPESQLKLQKLKEIEFEIHSVISETGKRKEECVELACELEKQPRVASRRSYIERISEITKNSRKLDADIDRILRDTRELKLESNSIEERLHRTYTVVGETISREAKKGSVGREAYQILTSIHETFEEIREKILATDKARREVAELEGKLSVIASRNLDVNKIQADVDAMRMENEELEKTLQIHHCGYSD